MLHHNIKGFVEEGEFIKNYSFGPQKPRLCWESFFHTPLRGLNVIANLSASKLAIAERSVSVKFEENLSTTDL